ncbi:M48 family metalloprotease [Kribbella sp. NPDC006257]|uniref:M48 family metalloprotease n=1 Tax=Kribbella sp. NPDC006257 TaxID=3156738 RepID=UPI0033B46D7F
MTGADSNNPERAPINLPQPVSQPLPARPATFAARAAAPPALARRPRHVGAWTDALLAGPWIVWSFLAVVFFFGWFVDFDDGPGFWIVMGVWIGSGLATLHPATEDLIARYVYRLRDLNNAEHNRIGLVWYNVCAAAGVNPSAFRIWICDADQITAPATSGHTIALTRWSLYTLDLPRLRAVLAHELAHHLGTTPRLSALVAWYAIPAQAAAVVIRRVWPVLRRHPVLLFAILAFWTMALAGLVLRGLVFGFSPMDFIWFTPLAAPFVLGIAGKAAERYADRQAADLGFGPELADVFQGWQTQAAHDQAVYKRARITSADPTVATRLRALEKHLGRGRTSLGTTPGRY